MPEPYGMIPRKRPNYVLRGLLAVVALALVFLVWHWFTNPPDPLAGASARNNIFVSTRTVQGRTTQVVIVFSNPTEHAIKVDATLQLRDEDTGQILDTENVSEPYVAINHTEQVTVTFQAVAPTNSSIQIVNATRRKV